jgi:hypothetical protein
LRKSRDARKNLVGGVRPYEGFRVRVMCVDELPNGSLKLGDAVVSTTAQLLIGQLGEPALDEIQPRTVRRREVNNVVVPWCL